VTGFLKENEIIPLKFEREKNDFSSLNGFYGKLVIILKNPIYRGSAFEFLNHL
jgi:hypothetical protein